MSKEKKFIDLTPDLANQAIDEIKLQTERLYEQMNLRELAEFMAQMLDDENFADKFKVQRAQDLTSHILDRLEGEQ